MDRNAADERLLADFAAGNRAALGELARRYELALLGLSAGMLGGARDLACDAVQETWVRVIRFASQFDGRSSFKTWLYRIAINQCRDLTRFRRRAAGDDRAIDGIGDAASGVTPSEAPTAPRRRVGELPARAERASESHPSPADSPDAAAAHAERDGQLRAAVERLAAEQRDAILLCYHAGMTHEQAADILEIPLGTLKSRLHAALERLRAQFLPEGEP